MLYAIRIILTLTVASFVFLSNTAWANQADSATSITPVQASTNTNNFQLQSDLLNNDAYYQTTAPARTFSTVANYAIYGGALGAILGLGAYAASGFDWTPWTIAYFAGGGVVAGAGVGLAVALLRESQEPVVSASLEWMERDAPKVYHLPALNFKF